MGKTCTVKITSQAEEQIQEIIHYIAHELKAPDAALHLLGILEDTFALSTDFPQRVVLVDEVTWRGNGIHRLPVKNFLVYFFEWGGIYGKRTGSDSGHRGGVGT